MTQNLVNRGARKAANVDAAFAKSATEGKKSTTKKSKKNKVVPGYVQFLRDYYAALASAFLMYTYLQGEIFQFKIYKFIIYSLFPTRPPSIKSELSWGTRLPGQGLSRAFFFIML